MPSSIAISITNGGKGKGIIFKFESDKNQKCFCLVGMLTRTGIFNYSHFSCCGSIPNVVCEESHELSGSTIFNGRDIIKLFLLHSLSMIETLTGPSSVVSDIVWPQASR